ncbi:MAG: DASS family sodium-coupled anion symporter [Cytophagales bacterium]
MADIDSRYAAIRMFTQKKMQMLFNTSTFTGNLVIAGIITYFFRNLGYGDAVDYVFFLALLSIGLWITEAIPPFAVGIFLIVMLIFGFGTDYIFKEAQDISIYVGTWTSNVIWLLLGGFFIAEAMKQVGLDRDLFNLTLKYFSNNPERLLLGLMLTTALGSMIMSNTATTAMMISSVLPLVHLLGKYSPYSKAVLVGIPAAASVGGIGTIIGSTPNAIAVGALQERGIHISFVDWMMVGFPTAIILVLSFWYYLTRKLDLKSVNLPLENLQQEKNGSSQAQKRAVLFTLIITVLMWLTEPFHGIPIAATSAIPIVLLTLTQVITAEEVRKLPWDTLMLVAGGLALGMAMVEVGLVDIIMNKINDLAFAALLVSFLFSVIAVLTSNVMSNTAAASIFVPLGLNLPYPFNIATPIIIAISCSCALMLPVSTPSNAVAYATGMIEQKDFRLGGKYFIVVGSILAFVASMIWVLIRFNASI